MQLLLLLLLVSFGALIVELFVTLPLDLLALVLSWSKWLLVLLVFGILAWFFGE